MMMDKQNLISDAQTIAAAAGTVVSTNSLDLGAAATNTLGGTILSDVGRAKFAELFVHLTEAVTSAGSATVDFQLIQSANSDLSSPTVLASTGAIAKATLVVGYRPRLALPEGITARYLGLQYVIAVATTTAGKVTAGLVFDKQTAHNA